MLEARERCGMAKRPEPEMSYFELQAYIGTTKHMGGMETSKQLIELCHIGANTTVLEVGCGAGATACYLAKRVGCRVVGVDLREGMVALAKDRARREGVEDRVEFRVADAQDLPFDDDLFDVVLSESVATFIEDKPTVVSEYVRVTQPGGYVGLNEEVWLKPPPEELVRFVQHTWDIEPGVPDAEGWQAMLEDAGLQDVAVTVYHLNARRESTQLKRYRFRDIFRMFYRTLVLYVKSPALRKYLKESKRVPKGFWDYWGYALLVGRKL